MKIPIPNKELIIPDKLKKVEVLGLHRKVTGSSPVAFSFTAAVDEILKHSTLEIDDALLEPVDKVQFKYVHNDTIKIAAWNRPLPGALPAKIKIGVPVRLKATIEKITSVSFKLQGDDEFFEAINVSKDTITTFDYFEIPLEGYNKAKTVKFDIILNNNNTDTVIFPGNKQEAVYRSKLAQSAAGCMKKNEKTPYDDDHQGRAACLAQVDELLKTTSKFSADSEGTRNLIYYAVYFDKGYVELFDLSLSSVLEHCGDDFDVLVITDNTTQKLLEKTEAAQKKSLKYFITETPDDGIEASKKKVSIYKYPQLNEYQNVLFLDCDIVAVGDMTDIFRNLKSDTFYSVKNKNLHCGHFRTIHHGFTTLSEAFVDEMRVAQQHPFNAGQFMFKPSERVLKHFDNVQWFMENWPSEYFFEQCFMCYYFCNAYMSDTSLLAKYIGLNSTVDDSIVDDDINDKPLVHFIAPPLDAKTKLIFIKNWLKQE